MGRNAHLIDTTPGWQTRRFRRNEKRAVEDRAARSAEATTIGRRGLRVKGGNIYIDEGGSVIIDGGDIEVVSGSIIAGVRSARHAELVSTGYRVVNANGQVDIDLTTTGDNRVLLRNPDGRNILLTGGQLTGDALNVNEATINGESLEAMITRISKSATPDEPPPSGVVRKSLTRTADWHQGYDNGGRPVAGPPTQGYSPYSQHGNQRAMIGFPDMTAELAAATAVLKVELHIYYDHWHAYAGGTAVIGFHGHTSPPGTWQGVPDQVRKANFPRNAWRDIDLTSVAPSGWIDGGKRGVVLGPGPSMATEYYGEARGAGSAVLKITWEEPG